MSLRIFGVGREWREGPRRDEAWSPTPPGVRVRTSGRPGAFDEASPSVARETQPCDPWKVT